MLRNLIVLPDGTELSSGISGGNAIKSTNITECVNSGEELTLGSVCANILEATIITPSGSLNLTAGDEVMLYKVDEAGERHRVGPFILEKPTYPSANIMKLTGYDRVIKLDKDLSEWLKSLTGWPYRLQTFAAMVCAECGLGMTQLSPVPNGNFLVREFFQSGATGRKIMGWLGEICCRFVRATASGGIEFGWYTPAGVSIAPTGVNYYFQGGLSYENYQVAAIDAVQLRLADGDSGALWPEAAEAANSYVITGNPVLMAAITEELPPYFEVILEELQGVTYTPCKVSIPASLNIHAGNTVQITDKNGKAITAYVMTKTQKGQKDTLECTGSARRDSATAVNNKTPSQIAQEKVDNQTQKEIFDKLTNNGEIQGLYVQDGKWYINAELVKIINLIVDHVLSEKNGATMEIEGANLTLKKGKSYAIFAISDTGYVRLALADDEHLGELLPSGISFTNDPETAGFYAAASIGIDPYLGKGAVRTQVINDKAVSWKKNNDGTYTLIGEDQT